MRIGKRIVCFIARGEGVSQEWNKAISEIVDHHMDGRLDICENMAQKLVHSSGCTHEEVRSAIWSAIEERVKEG